jgi:hypothetical protein
LEVHVSYNGYKNYSTWCVSLWLGLDVHDYRHWCKRAEELREVSDGDMEHYSVDILVREIRYDVMGKIPLGDGSMYHDLLCSALGSVDWEEVANTFLEE